MRHNVIIPPPEETKKASVKPSAILVIKYSDRRELFARVLLVLICALLFIYFFIWVERHTFHFAYQRHSVSCSGYSEIFTCDAWKTASLDSATLYPLLPQYLCFDLSLPLSFSLCMASISFFVEKDTFNKCVIIMFIILPLTPLLCTLCKPVKIIMICC